LNPTELKRTIGKKLDLLYKTYQNKNKSQKVEISSETYWTYKTNLFCRIITPHFFLEKVRSVEHCSLDGKISNEVLKSYNTTKNAKSP